MQDMVGAVSLLVNSDHSVTNFKYRELKEACLKHGQATVCCQVVFTLVKSFHVPTLLTSPPGKGKDLNVFWAFWACFSLIPAQPTAFAASPQLNSLVMNLV